jgi:hypothetical protein
MDGGEELRPIPCTSPRVLKRREYLPVTLREVWMTERKHTCFNPRGWGPAHKTWKDSVSWIQIPVTLNFVTYSQDSTRWKLWFGLSAVRWVSHHLSPGNTEWPSHFHLTLSLDLRSGTCSSQLGSLVAWPPQRQGQNQADTVLCSWTLSNL